MNMRKMLGAFAAALLMMGVLALPAAAVTTGTGLITAGTARVGKWFTTNDPCDKSGVATVGGPGLYVAGSPADQARARQGVWAIGPAVIQGVGIGQNGSGLHTAVLNACGWLDRVPGTGGIQWPLAPPGEKHRYNGLGAACGASKGFDGKGRVQIFWGSGGVDRLKLFNLGWKSAVGGVLPVIGNYQDWANDGDVDGDGIPIDVNDSKKEKYGTIIAEIVAQGATACLDANGAQIFTVAGPFELINGVEATPNDPTGSGLVTVPKTDDGDDETESALDNEKKCKDTGPKGKVGKPAKAPCKGPGNQKPTP